MGTPHPPSVLCLSTLFADNSIIRYDTSQLLERQDLPCTFLAHDELESIQLFLLLQLYCNIVQLYVILFMLFGAS